MLLPQLGRSGHKLAIASLLVGMLAGTTGCQSSGLWPLGASPLNLTRPDGKHRKSKDVDTLPDADEIGYVPKDFDK